MKRLLIVWHSRTGAAKAMAEAAARGAAQEPDVETRLVAAEDAGPHDLKAADGYIFAAPENLAALSGEMKAFLDRSYYPVLEQLNGRPYGVLIAAGSDGTGALRQLTRIVTGWRLKMVAEPVIVNLRRRRRRRSWPRKRPRPPSLNPARCWAQRWRQEWR